MKNVKVVNLAGYEVPKIVEKSKNAYVEYGEDNNYFGDLIEKYLW